MQERKPNTTISAEIKWSGKPHLTDRIVRDLTAPAKGNKVHYDGELPGFGCRVTAAGSKSFVFNYVVRSTGRDRRITIGSTTSWKVADARKEAKRLRQLVDQGGDPLGDIAEARAAPTVAELITRFKEEHVGRKRPSTQQAYGIMLDRHIGPALGKLKVADVAFADVDGMHRRLSKTSGGHSANRCVAVTSKMFSLAIRWGMRTDNPAKGIERNSEGKRKRYMSGDELARITAALAAHSDQQSANIIRMLMLTGARRGEALSMRWADVDLSKGTWTKPGSTTKQKTDHEAFLSAPARQLLSEIRDAQLKKHPKRPLGEYVFAGLGDSGHQMEIKKSWASICKVAGIEGLRVHDLRHSFASQVVSGGGSLALIGALLGHSNPTTTQRYAHMFSDPQREAVERVGAIIGAAGKPEPAEPVTFKPRGR